MNEWLLILTMSLIGQAGEIRDVSPVIVGGFQSKQSCDSAAAAIGDRLLYLSGKTREQQGIPANAPKGMPSLWFECLLIRK